MTQSFIFRTGKYAGKTYEWVSANDFYYLDWVARERPEMLKERTRPKPNARIEPPDDDDESCMVFLPMNPNANFENELYMTPTELIEGTKEIKYQLAKIKIGLYARLCKETNQNGRIKYDKEWLINHIFTEDEEDIKIKLKSRLNG
jgi:hypothetical protein